LSRIQALRRQSVRYERLSLDNGSNVRIVRRTLRFFRQKKDRFIRKSELWVCRLEQSVVPGQIISRRVRRTRQIRPILTVPSSHKRRLYVDLAVISVHDSGTGIQRVVRALALALTKANPLDLELHFVTAGYGVPYHCTAWPELPVELDRTPIVGRAGDIFLGLDYSLETIRWNASQLVGFRRDGGQLWFLVHDLLPVQKPGWFSSKMVLRYRAWLQILASTADGFLCNSAQTEADLRIALAERFGLVSGYRTQVLPMGCDIAASNLPTSTATAVPSISFAALKPFVLMVGTLEPRKGHADILRAFDRLWREGCEYRLVIIGSLGWRVGALRELIEAHAEFGERLFWFDDIDDSTLIAAYRASEGVIVASYGEGFGLPLIEALGYGRSVLARDLMIFRPHRTNGVRYFPADADTPTLIKHIALWLDALAAGEINVTPPHADWGQSVETLLSAIVSN